MKKYVYFMFVCSALYQPLTLAEDQEASVSSEAILTIDTSPINNHLVRLIDTLEHELQEDNSDTKDLTTKIRNFITKIETDNLYLSNPAVNTLSTHLSNIKEKDSSE